jgi:hypothetical protein
MSLPTLVRTDGKSKSFWERPEGVTGMVTLAAIAIGGLFAVNAILPTILAVLSGLILAVGKGIVLGGLVALAFGFYLIATSPSVHALVSYGFKLIMRSLTGALIEIDPIGIMKLYIEDLKKRLGEMNKRLQDLSGQIRAIRDVIAKNEAKQKKALSMATLAEREGMKAQFTLNARKAGRASQSNLRYEDLLAKMELLYAMLKKYYEASEIMILDMTDEVETREVDRKATLAAYGAMQGAKDILAGSGDKREMYDRALEYSVNDASMKLGEIEHFMTMSQSFIEGLDLENGAFDAEAMEKIQAWESKADSLLLGNAKQQSLNAVAATPLNVAPSSYASLIKK